DLWNTRYFILPLHPGDWGDATRGFASFLANTEAVYPSGRALEGTSGKEQAEAASRGDVQVRRNLACFPRAGVVHAARDLPAADTSGPAQPDPMRDEILFSEDDAWFDPNRTIHDPRAVAWIERDRRAELRPYLDGRPASGAEQARVTRYAPDR